MHVRHSANIAILLALAPVVIVAQNTTTPPNIPLNFNCSTFSAPGGGRGIRNYTAPYNQTLRVSPAVICPDDADANYYKCNARASGTVNVTATSNATDIPDAQLLHAMLYQALRHEGASNAFLNDFGTAVWKKVFNNTGNAGQSKVPPGSAGYMAFTPKMTCYDGVVSTNSSCSSSDEGIKNVKDRFEGRALQICVPRLYSTGSGKRRRNRLAGTVELVRISKEEAGTEEMKRNPASSSGSSTSDDDDDDAVSPTPSGTVIGGAGGIEMQWVSLGAGMLMAVGMVGWM